MRLQRDWCLYIVNSGVDVKAPGIYEWRIEGGEIYIGKYSHIRRPTRAYRSNVTRLLSGKPYRSGGDYRRVHHALAKAVQAGKTITLTILENVLDDQINRRERELIGERGTLND
jgi:hypothetical protein